MRFIALLLLTLALPACTAAKPQPTMTPFPVATASSSSSPTALPAATSAPVPSNPSPTSAPTTPTVTPLTGPAAQILTKTATVRELAVKRDVASGTLSRDELRSYLMRAAKQNGAEEELERTKALLVALELLDESEDLYTLWLDTLGEQVAGFYEFETQQMKLIKSGGLGEISTGDELVLAHEYAHALQDQHFSLGPLMDHIKQQGEATTALTALVEGDATLSMAEYARRYKTPEQLADVFGRPTRMDSDRFRSAPSVVQSSLLFPYQQGTAFVAKLFQNGGWSAVNAAYSRPPVSTEQILHPDRYQKADGPQNVDLPNVTAVLGGNWKQLDSDTIGELGWLLYLGSGRPVRNPGISGWGGDRYVLFRDDSKKLALASLIVWDTPRNATDFFSGVRQMQKARTDTTLPELAGDRLSWTGKRGSGYAALNGFQVLLVITPDEATTKKVVARFAGYGN